MLIKMKNPIKIFLVISVFVFFAGIAFSQDLIELQVIADSDTTSIYFGTDADGTDGLDVGLDAILPPSPPGFTGIRPYFLIEHATFPKLIKDIRLAGNLSNVWKLLFEGSGSGTVNWKTSDIPVGENYTLAGLDMHNNDKYSFDASETIVISYSTSSSLIFNLTVSGGEDVIVLTYGMSAEATDNFDSGIDEPSPPAVPGDNFNAFFASTGTFSSLEKDIRSNLGLTKEWIVKVEGELSGEVSWDNALFPTLGKFTIGDINMRDQDSCLIEANSELILKYQKPGIPLTLVSSAGDTVKVTFGISYDATDGYDENIDFIGPPAVPGKIDAYFSNTDPAPYNHLSTDMRGVLSNLLSWDLVTSNAAGTVYWNSADLPANGNFRLEGMDMRVASEYSFSLGASIDIAYNAENYNLNDLTFVSSESDTIILTFGTCVDASDEFDADIDAISPPAPPAGFYAYFSSAQSSPYDKLSTDVRNVGNSYDKWNIATFRLGGTIHWNAEAITGGTYRLGNVYLNEAVSYTFVADEALVLERFDNAAPYFVDTMPDTTIDEGQALSYTYTATDPDADVVTYSLIGAPPEGAAIDDSTGEFTWTPTYEQAGTYDIVAVVSDGALTDTSSTAVVIVLDYVPGVDLFFSEYIEGSSYNKALEIYNGKGVAVNLAEYSIKGTHNGDADWEYAGFNFPDIELAAGDVYVICDVGAGPEITAIADTLLVYDPNKTMGFNGDDARGIEKRYIYGTDTTWVLIDVIGFTDGDPGNGWDVAGVTDATKDHTLIRKATVTMGNVNFAISAGTDEATSEWVVMPQNTFGFLGDHPHTDFVGPEIAGVVAISGTALQVRFSEEVDPVAAAAVANYSIDGGIGNPASVEMVKNNIAVLTIAAIEANAPYTVSVTGVKDLTDLALVDTTVGFKLVDPGELPIDITIDDFETNIGSWFDPNYSGSTSGVLDGSTFEVSDEFAYAGSKSGKMTLLDDPAVEGGWFVRNNNRTEKIAPDSKLFLYLRGADADVQLRFVIWDNGAGGDGYEAGAWNDITVTEDDWQVISIDLASDPVTGWITGNGAINSTDFVTIESIQLRCSEDISTVLYFDMVTERPIVVGIEDVSALPKEFALHQNYPNPFNPITTIKYELPKESLVKIIVFDLMGKEVRTLVSQKQNAGYQTVIWNATDNYGRKVSSGYYIYIMQAESFHKTQKMILLK